MAALATKADLNELRTNLAALEARISRRRLNQLPPRLATLTAEQWAAAEAAGRVDRIRKAGGPCGSCSPRDSGGT